MITKAVRAEWRKEQGLGMISALGEYTPSEFWEALDEIDRLEKALEEIRDSTYKSALMLRAEAERALT